MRITFTLTVLTLSLSFGSGPAFARQPAPAHEQPSSMGPDTAPASIRFERLTADDGLSSQVVFEAIQDQRGFMWFGTWSGLNRYDGYSFTHYKHTPLDSTSIAANNIWSLYEDRSGALWVGSALGVLSRFDQVTERFAHFKHVPDDSTSLRLDGIWAMHEDRSGRLWVGRFDGLNRMNPETGTSTRYRYVPGDASSLSNNSVADIHEDESGALWVSTANGLNRIDPETGKCTRFLYEPHASGEPAQNASYDLRDIYEDLREPGILWIGSRHGLLRFDTASGEHARFLPDLQGRVANGVTGIAPDPDHPEVLWLATGGGLYRFDQRTGRFNGYHHDPGDPTSLSNDVLTHVYTDRTGIIWACTQEHGVNKFDPAEAGVVHYRRIPGDSNSLPGNTISGLYEDRAGALWVGLSEEGLARIDRRTGQVTTWKLPFVKAILEDRSGTLWAGTYSGGLHRLDPATGTFIQYHYDPMNSGTFGANQTFRLLEDRAGILWIGSLNGLKRMDPETGTFTRFDHDPEDPTSLSDKFVVSLYEDRAGTLWVGTTRGGLNRMDRATGTFTRYQNDPQNPNSLSSNAVWSLLEREREPGVLWIGTDGGGLNRFETRTGRFTHFITEDGVADNTVWGILEDEQGRLWISTPGGLSRFDLERQTFRNYTGSRLQSREFKDQAYFKSRSGELFFGGVNGFNAFFPADMRDNPHPPQVALTGLKLFNQPVPVAEASPLEQPIWRTEEVRLAHNQNSVSFDFVALHYRNPQQNQYTYRLEGFDPDWVQGRGPHTATYTNLDPGAYVFQVKASNSDGVWNEAGASVRVVIRPPWWRTWWAYALYGLLFVGGIFAVNRVQRRRLIRRERIRAERETEKLRTEAAEHLANYLQSENQRQTQELEQARVLQLSMLPERVPEHPVVEIAAFMKTASEVGGDYYDFHMGPDGTLTFAIGDATGHGMAAGTMVTAMKGLFTDHAEEPDLVEVLGRSSRALRRMHLPKLYMALALGRLRDHTLEFVGAGMPPALVYRTSSGCIEEVALKGMPLGGPGDYPYRRQCVLLSEGDTVVLMSDGLPELRGESGELLGYECMPALLAEAAGRKPEAIIAHLMGIAKAWCDGQAPGDDMTFIVMQVKA